MSEKQFMILSCSGILQVFFRIFFAFTEQENVVRDTVHDPLLPWPLPATVCWKVCGAGITPCGSLR